MVSVLYFAACRVRTGLDREDVELAGLTVRDAVGQLCARHPALEEIAPQCRVALDHAFVDADTLVPATAEFALIPPVAGG